MPEIEVPPTDDELMAHLRKVAGTHNWGDLPMLFMIEWDGRSLNGGTVVGLDLKQHEIPPAIMFFAAEALTKGEKPFLFLVTFEGWMVRVAADVSDEERAVIERQTRERQLHTRADAIEQFVLHGVTVDGRNCTGLKSSEGLSVQMSTATAADGELVAALQSSAAIAGQIRRGEPIR